MCVCVCVAAYTYSVSRKWNRCAVRKTLGSCILHQIEELSRRLSFSFVINENNLSVFTEAAERNIMNVFQERLSENNGAIISYTLNKILFLWWVAFHSDMNMWLCRTAYRMNSSVAGRAQRGTFCAMRVNNISTLLKQELQLTLSLRIHCPYTWVTLLLSITWQQPVNLVLGQM